MVSDAGKDMGSWNDWTLLSVVCACPSRRRIDVGEEDGDTIKVSDADGYTILRKGFDDRTQVSFQCFDPATNREVFKVWATPRFSKLVERGALFD